MILDSPSKTEPVGCCRNLWTSTGPCGHPASLHLGQDLACRAPHCSTHPSSWQLRALGTPSGYSPAASQPHTSLEPGPGRLAAWRGRGELCWGPTAVPPQVRNTRLWCGQVGAHHPVHPALFCNRLRSNYGGSLHRAVHDGWQSSRLGSPELQDKKSEELRKNSM